MPYRYPPEFRGKVLDRLAAGRSVASLSADLGVSDQTIYNWRRQDAVDRGVEPGLSSSEKEELRSARRRIAELATELAVDRYMQDEGSNNLRVGHRRQILSAFVEEIGTGNVYDEDGPHRAANAMHLGYDYSSDATVREPRGFVAWPPAGYVPAKTVWGRWSFQLPDAEFSKATVAVTDTHGPIPTQVINREGSSRRPAIIWAMYGDPNSEQFPRFPNRDHSYRVTISNVTVADRAQIPFQYFTCLIDPGSESDKLGRYLSPPCGHPTAPESPTTNGDTNSGS